MFYLQLIKMLTMLLLFSKEVFLAPADKDANNVAVVFIGSIFSSS